MKFKGLELVIPRRDVNHFIDIMIMNKVAVTRAEDLPPDAPVIVTLSIAEEELFEMEGEMCESCGEWNGSHDSDCESIEFDDKKPSEQKDN